MKAKYQTIIVIPIIKKFCCHRCVTDNGIDIDPEIFDKLFTKFTTNSFQGIGLGLYLCRKTVEAQGGEIWVENNKEGKGATFSFSL